MALARLQSRLNHNDGPELSPSPTSISAQHSLHFCFLSSSHLRFHSVIVLFFNTVSSPDIFLVFYTAFFLPLSDARPKVCKRVWHSNLISASSIHLSLFLWPLKSTSVSKLYCSKSSKTLSPGSRPQTSPTVIFKMCLNQSSSVLTPSNALTGSPVKTQKINSNKINAQEFVCNGTSHLKCWAVDRLKWY